MRKSPPIRDERVRKIRNQLCVIPFWVMNGGLAIALVVKLILGGTLNQLAPDAICLAGLLGAWAVMRTVHGLWGEMDDALWEIDEAGTAFICRVGWGVAYLLPFAYALVSGSTEWETTPMLAVLASFMVYSVRCDKAALPGWGGEQNRRRGKWRVAGMIVLVMAAHLIQSLILPALLRGRALSSVFDGSVYDIVLLVLWAVLGLLWYRDAMASLDAAEEEADIRMRVEESLATRNPNDWVRGREGEDGHGEE